MLDSLFIAATGIGGDRHDRDVTQRFVRLQHLDQFEAADMRQLDIGDDQIRREGARPFDRVATIGHRFGLKVVRAQQIAEKFQIEFVVLDNVHPLCHLRTPSQVTTDT